MASSSTTRGADERLALSVFVVAGGLAHEHQFRLRVADAEHEVRPRARQRAQMIGGAGFVLVGGAMAWAAAAPKG